MWLEVTSLAKTMKVSLERTSLPWDMTHDQGLLGAMNGPAWTLGVILCHQGRNLSFRSLSLEGGLVLFFDLIQSSIHQNRGGEQCGPCLGPPFFRVPARISEEGS